MAMRNFTRRDMLRAGGSKVVRPQDVQADIAWAVDPDNPRSLSFQLAIGAGVEVSSVSYAFGDGASESASGNEKVSHVYDEDGTYTVVAGITLAAGSTATRAQIVQVAGMAPYTESEEIGDEVPEGTVKELERWIGDSVERAQAALQAEESRANPRSGLIRIATGIIEDGKSGS